MFRDALRPGDKAPESGTYWVHHYQHRTVHASHVGGGTAFPSCSVCGDRVRFERAITEDGAPDLGEDRNFSPEPLEDVAG